MDSIKRTEEIQEQVKRRYLERLSNKVGKMRRLAASKDWNKLQNEVDSVQNSARGFGYERLFDLACETTRAIDRPGLTRAHIPMGAKTAVENLFSEIDHILTQDSIERFQA